MHVLKQAVLGSLGLVLLVAGAAAPAQEMGGDFSPSSQPWVDAYNAGNVDTIVAMYADDAVLMPPGAPGASGAAAMRAYLEKDIAGAREAGITLTIVDGASGSSGNLGWHAGTYSVMDKDGNAVDTGKYLEVWRRQGGQWRMIRDIWNSDMPAGDQDEDEDKNETESDQAATAAPEDSAADEAEPADEGDAD